MENTFAFSLVTIISWPGVIWTTNALVANGELIQYQMKWKVQKLEL